MKKPAVHAENTAMSFFLSKGFSTQVHETKARMAARQVDNTICNHTLIE